MCFDTYCDIIWVYKLGEVYNEQLIGSKRAIRYRAPSLLFKTNYGRTIRSQNAFVSGKCYMGSSCGSDSRCWCDHSFLLFRGSQMDRPREGQA